MKKAFNKIASLLFAQWSRFFNTVSALEMKIDETPACNVLRDGALNKSTAFTREERDKLSLRGLLPYAVNTQDEQKELVLEHLKRKPSNIEKYIYLSALQERNERLFYYTALNEIEQVMPLIYTPTVGEACKNFASVFRNTRGMYITPDDKGSIRTILDNWQQKDVQVIVITDGQRILGLGDLGANGMGIPIGKLSLYTICGGVAPSQCLPIMFDVGTDNIELLKDPLYLGYPHERLKGSEYYELMEEFVDAVKDKFPHAMIQFEDFLTPNAFKLLNIYRDKTLCFNDDIQGTAAVTLAGIYAASLAAKVDFEDMDIMFLGAGSAATGIADLIVTALMEKGLNETQARSKLWLVDSKGLVTSDREHLADHKTPYARDYKAMDFISAMKDIKPQILIGATGAPGSFTQEAIRQMSKHNEHPIIFALSNPTSHAECTAIDAYEWSNGKALFASGSPFDPVEHKGNTFYPGQSNNAYIFPGLGLGATYCRASKITEEMFLAASKALADSVSLEDLKKGTLYPPLTKIRDVSLKIAKAVIKTAKKQGLSTIDLPDDLEKDLKEKMYDPSYGPKGAPTFNSGMSFKP